MRYSNREKALIALLIVLLVGTAYYVATQRGSLVACKNVYSGAVYSWETNAAWCPEGTAYNMTEGSRGVVFVDTLAALAGLAAILACLAAVAFWAENRRAA